MPTRGKSLTERVLQIFAVFGIFGMSWLGVQLLAAGPCDIPKTWSVGKVDPQFGLSEQMVAQYGKEATQVWNEAHPENTLLVYRENGGDVKLNFIYDERMQTTIRNQRLKRNITQGREELTDLRETIGSLRTEYRDLESTIETLTYAYDSRLNTYNKEVAYWNSQGGAPQDVYARLERTKAGLEDERNSLNVKISYYNELGEKVRTYGEDHNEIVVSLNEQITALNDSAGREFEEGIYNPNDNTITVYEYASPTALKRVLIHEFGHAISIGHVEGEDSIMYPVNQSKNLTLSDEDLAALQSVCSRKGLGGIFETSSPAFGVIRDGISRLVGLSSRDTAAQLE